MTKKKKATAAATAVVTAALLFAGSFAWLSTKQTATNKFRKADYNVVLHDVFEGKEIVTDINGENISETMEWTDEKDTLDKDIWVTNNGSGDILIHVKLTEKLKANNHEAVFEKNSRAILKGANTSKTYGTDTESIRDYVEWQIGDKEWSEAPTIMTYEEWQNLTDPAQKTGEFWVIDSGGNMIWMERLKASDSKVKAEASALGNTALLLDAVKLKNGVKGQVNYSIKVEMEAIDADLVGNDMWHLGATCAVLYKAAANSERLATLKSKRDAVANVSIKQLYNDAINAALENKSDDEIATITNKAESLQALIDSDDSYNQSVITHDTANNVYKLKNGAIIDTKLAEWIAEKYGRNAVTDVTKADLAALYSITTNNNGIESFAGLTVDYFPNLTRITLLKENGISVTDINDMDDNMKQQLKYFIMQSCSGIQGNIDVSKFVNLKDFSLRSCANIDDVVGLSSKLEHLNFEQSSIKNLDIQNCKRLESLNLWNCKSLGLDDGGIRGLGSLQTLQLLNISGCHFQSLVIGSPKLISLDLSECKELTTLTLVNEAFTNENAKYPIELNIKNCSALSGIDISRMTLINRLDIRGCTKLLENVNANVKKSDTQILITK